MGDKDSEQNALVDILVNPSAEAKELPFSLLKDITDFFSNECVIGGGTFGVVYKGELRNGMKVAVKRLKHFGWILDDKKFYAEFYAEVDCLKKLKNKNIVRLLGYCVHIETAELMVDGKKVPAERNPERLLCFEFVPHGTVQKAGASHGAEWPKRYQIIKGICHGLEYIHNAKYLHLDLKPDNILLGENMEPKIADFGVSRFFGDQSTHDTMRNSGTRGYMAPEYINKGTVSEKTDIYSLGVVIFELVTGSKGPDVHESTHKQKDLFLEKALLDWKKSLCDSHRGRSLELAYQQVETCIKIALNCTDLNRNLRRPIKEIAHILDLASNYDLMQASNPYILDAHTTEGAHVYGVRFQDNPSFVPSKKFKLGVMAVDTSLSLNFLEGISDGRGFLAKEECHSYRGVLESGPPQASLHPRRRWVKVVTVVTTILYLEKMCHKDYVSKYMSDLENMLFGTMKKDSAKASG